MLPSGYRQMPDPESGLSSPTLHAQTQLKDLSVVAYSHLEHNAAMSGAKHAQSTEGPISPGYSHFPILGNCQNFQLPQNLNRGLAPGLPVFSDMFSSANSTGNTQFSQAPSSRSLMQPVIDSMHSVLAGPDPQHFLKHDVQYCLRQMSPNFTGRAFMPKCMPDQRMTFPGNTPTLPMNSDSPVQQVVNEQNHMNLTHPQQFPVNTTAGFQSLQQSKSAELLPQIPTRLKIENQAYSCLQLEPAPPISPALQPHLADTERQPRKKPRAGTQQDTERQLLSLANGMSGVTLQESAQKIKRMECDSSELKNDPVLGQICNSKDIKQGRHHQVFALTWLGKSCEASPASVVPRNRIYARYVQMCGEFTLIPLLPAAFGRLVRILFPNLTTRRLGMRGKSKYHYCGVKLKGDLSQVGSPLSSYSSMCMNSPLPSSVHTLSHTDSPGINTMFAMPFSFVNVQEHFLINDFKYVPGLYGRIEQSILDEHENNSFGLPSIYSYLPKDLEFDSDIADTLHSLVKIQCKSIFELVRFMRKDDLFRALLPPPAMLKGPLFKLLNSDCAVEWVKECDFVMYRAMLKLLTRLHLSSISKDTVGILREISVGFVGKLSAALCDRFSQNYKTMKLKLARQFIELVSRLLRCIETGSRAAIVLSNAADRSLMLLDWSKLNFRNTVLREIPCRVEISKAIMNILEVQVVQLLKDTTQEASSLARYAAFLFELPGQFSSVNPWLFVLLLLNLLTGFIREMSMVGSRSFKLWWIVGCWIKEYISWSFELGGYLYKEFYAGDDTPQTSAAFDMDFSASLSSGSDFNVTEKLFSTVDLLGGSHNHI